MPPPANDLGKLVSVHVISPAYMQRAVFLVVLSFLFFLGTMFVYYLRQNILYFLLASAFLLVYLFTLFSLVMQRRNQAQIFESGLRYKMQSARWEEVDEVGSDGTISLSTGKKVTLPRSLHDIEKVLEIIRERSGIRK